MTQPDSFRDRIRQRLRATERAKYGQEYFREEYWKEDLEQKTGNRGLSYDDPDHGLRFDFLASLFLAHIPFTRLIDVGCAQGHLIDRVRDKGRAAFGCDVAPHALRTARRRFAAPVALASIEALPFADACGDLVTCLDVLEHVTVLDVEDAVTQLSRISTGWIVATINLDNPYEFHPTILSRSSWEALFELSGGLRQDATLQETLQRKASERFPEYDFFVYRRKS